MRREKWSSAAKQEEQKNDIKWVLSGQIKCYLTIWLQDEKKQKLLNEN